MRSISGVAGAQAAAVEGIRRAEREFEKAAAQVVDAGAQGHQAAEVSFSKEARGLAEGQGQSESQSGDRGLQLQAESAPADIAEGLVNAQVAKQMHAAQVRVLATADEMSEELTRLK